MRKKHIIFSLLVVAVAFGPLLSAAQDADSVIAEFPVLLDGKIYPMTGFGVGIDDSQHLRDWLAETVDGLEMRYPGGLQWAALFITVGGDAVPPPRPFQDFSQYKTLVVEMKGESGGECVMVGIKDFDDPDDGSEPKTSLILTNTWEFFPINIDSTFADRHRNRSALRMERLYVVTEFVFPCASNAAQTVYVKSIKYLR